MKGQVQAVFLAAAIAALLPTVAPAAQARECRAAAPSQGGHWSWRMIDGRKCWYSGKAMMSKALLRWPATAAARAVSIATPDPVATDTRSDPMNAQAQMPDEADSFESRWQARARGL